MESKLEFRETKEEQHSSFFNSLLTVTKGHLTLNGFEVSESSTFGNGGAIRAQSEGTVIIEDGLFKDCIASTGGVFWVRQKSQISCTNCTVQNSLALSSSIIEVTEDGSFLFENSTFKHNQAVSNLITEIADSVRKSSLSSIIFGENKIISDEEFLDSLRL